MFLLLLLLLLLSRPLSLSLSLCPHFYLRPGMGLGKEEKGMTAPLPVQIKASAYRNARGHRERAGSIGCSLSPSDLFVFRPRRPRQGGGREKADRGAQSQAR